MPRRTSSSTHSAQSSKGNSSKSSRAQSSKRATRKSVSKVSSEQIPDDHTKRDIIGIVLIVLAVVLFVTALLPSTAVVTGFVSRALRLGIGLGVYLFPIFLAAVGVCVIVKPHNEQLPAKVVIGLCMILLAILVLLALFTPDAQDGQAEILFDQHAIVMRGGYVGAGVAWAGLNLFGQVISVILMVGVIVAGLALIGASISRLAERMGERRKIRAEQKSQEDVPSAKFTKGRSHKRDDISQVKSASPDLHPSRMSSLETQVFPHSHTEITDSHAPTQVLQSEVANTETVEDASDNVPTQSFEGLQTQVLPTGVENNQIHDMSEACSILNKSHDKTYDQDFDSCESTSVESSKQTLFVPFDTLDDNLPDIPDFIKKLDGEDTSELQSSGIASHFSDDTSKETFDALQSQTKRTRNTIESITSNAETEGPITRKLGSLPTIEQNCTTLEELPSIDVNAASVAAAAVGACATKASSSQSQAKNTKRVSSIKKPITPISQPQPQDGFVLPPYNMLSISRPKARGKSLQGDLQATANALQQTLQDFNINATVVGWIAGPTVTLFKVDLPAGVRVNRVTNLSDDIALALATTGIRIFAPIPGTNYVGIEVPNKQRQTVLLGDVLSDATDGPLQIAIGKDVEGNSIISDLSKMPHLLIGGTTGSGKSVSINAMIMSILMRATPAEVRFILIDPKRVEFTPYNGIPHLYVPVVTEAKEAASALSWGVAEMERRLKVFSKVGARNIGQYNAKIQSGQLDEETAEELPYIVIVIDELADLMMNVGKEVEFSISRIAQLARAAGIHLIVATQRPSANVVTGLIKANITNRIAFNVASGIDSRVILDTPGAEHLIGLGDLLFNKPELAKPQRIQGCYVSEDEIYNVVEFLKEQGEPEYHSEILKTNLITLGASQPDGSGGSSSPDDPLIWEAADIVVSAKFGSTSNIQRRLKVGYSRAGRIMDSLEEKGIVGPANGSKPREVLVDTLELESIKAFEMNGG